MRTASRLTSFKMRFGEMVVSRLRIAGSDLGLH